MSNEQRYYDALRRIAKEYMTTEQLIRNANREWGVSYHEALEMSYDNIQGCASDAIRGRRRPKDVAKPAPKPTEATASEASTKDGSR